MMFFKMQGLGNDYVYIDCINRKEPIDIENLSRKLSNRHFGIGSDGLILLCKSNVADLKMRMFNSDGTEAQMCGNGIRGVAKLAYELGMIKAETAKIETLSGIKDLKLNIIKGNVKTVEVDMGEPIFEPYKIPVLNANVDGKKVITIIEAQKRKFEFNCVSMGNPHAVTFIKKVEKLKINNYGPVLESANVFPEKANIEFAEIIDDENIKMRVWERGSGETLACGTGACAAVVASYLNGYTGRKVTVHLLGRKT